jgi:hypothetical protein
MELIGLKGNEKAYQRRPKFNSDLCTMRNKKFNNLWICGFTSIMKRSFEEPFETPELDEINQEKIKYFEIK